MGRLSAEIGDCGQAPSHVSEALALVDDDDRRVSLENDLEAVKARIDAGEGA